MRKNAQLPVMMFLIFLLASCNSTQKIQETVNVPSNTKTPTTAPFPTPDPSPTATAPLSPIGQIQEIPEGYVYLGDPKTMALGFNMDAGGGIGSLLYNNIEMIDDADFGRYINFSPYDGSDQYICNPSSCFTTWGWNPLQTGSVDFFPAKVLEFRRTSDSIYIKTQAVDWGHNSGYSDVVFETWAWDRKTYFELVIRLNHLGNDTHSLSGNEFPAAYFSKDIPIQYGYTGSAPFTGAEIETLNSTTYDLGTATNKPIMPSENWLAFGNQSGTGLSLVLPNQEYLTPFWSDIFIKGASPFPIGYIAPKAIFATLPQSTIDLHFYLIPGDIAKTRSIVYDLLPHTTWTFDLNSAEGWSTDNNSLSVEDKELSVRISSQEPLVSMSKLDFYGSQISQFQMKASSNVSSAKICLQFITKKDWKWDENKSICSQLEEKYPDIVQFDFSHNSYWQGNIISQLRLISTEPVLVSIDWLNGIHNYYGGEFDDPETTDGWTALYDLSPLSVNGSNLITEALTNDPYMTSPFLGISAQDFSLIQIRMKVERGDSAQIFFTTESETTHIEANSMSFPIRADGQFHDYLINMGIFPNWKGVINSLRFDPTNAQGEIAIDYIHILPRQISFDPFTRINWDSSNNQNSNWQMEAVQPQIEDQGTLVKLSTTDFVDSPKGFYFYGIDASGVEIDATIKPASGQMCLQFTTIDNTVWDKEKMLCLSISSEENHNYFFPLSQNLEWTNGIINRLRFFTSESTSAELDKISVIPDKYGWEFNYPPDADGWSPWNQLSQLTVYNDAVEFELLGSDPYMGTQYLMIPANEFSQIVIRIKTSTSGKCKFYFVSDKSPDWSEQNSISFPVVGDNQYHEYTIDLSTQAAWQGKITQLRLDPLDAPGNYSIDYIRIEKLK